jgi:hypothetical protein
MDCKRVVGLAVCMVWSAAAVAQQSASFKLHEQSFNAGGHPRDGAMLASTSFRITLDSIGDALAEPLATSTSFHMAGGFASSYPPPGEVLGLDFADESILGWETEGSVGTYALYRAATTTLPGLAYGACLDSGLTDESYTDLDLPSAGQAYFYLVTARNLLGEEGTKGNDSSGAERANPAPCP